jgi:large subunit ribosomal protein L7A
VQGSNAELFSKELTKRDCIVGFREVQRELRQDRIERVYLAEDADSDLCRRVASVCDSKNIPLSYYKSKKEAGEWFGLDVPCAVVGVRSGPDK